jgi:hypothetical protein
MSEEKEILVVKGAFLDSLKRNNKQIRDDRAEAIGEDAQMMYKREVEDHMLNLKRMKREQENMLDLSPGDKLSLTLATDFKSKEYVTKDIELAIKIREEQIIVEEASKRYIYLFGEEI